MQQPIKWHGGKHYLAPKIIKLMPAHDRYLEAYSGGLSVLLQKPFEGISEFANDLNGELINFWRVLRDTPARMLHALWGTPLSQDAFLEAKEDASTDRVKQATAFFIRMRMSRQGLGKDYCTPTSRTRRGMNEQVSAWLSAIEGLPEVHARLQRVEVWQRPAVEAITKLDCESFLVYADPPYLHETRSSTGEYGAFEMTQEQHVELLECLAGIKGKFLLSGYPSGTYDRFAAMEGWRVHEFDLPNNASSSKSKQRKTEVVWSNF